MPHDAQHGFVSLVGAGPGDPDLITVRGLRRLRAADVVLYDALIPVELLDETRPDAERVFVGKRGYCVGSTAQDDINRLMVDFARAGRRVCRLKGGDPYVFGRGGEEAELLAAAGIPFEVVPGITSAFAGCAAAGIPLTHRAAGQSVALVSGHHDPDGEGCDLDWHALARMSNLVFYMGLRHVEKIVRRLTDAGLDPATPAAVIESATRPCQRVIDGPLRLIAERARAAGVQAPALIVVGEPVRCRSTLSPSPLAEEGVPQGVTA
jgi:uroporphyrin-III C-methyltransferase